MIHEALKQTFVHKFKTWMLEYCEQEHVLKVENMNTSYKILSSARSNLKGFIFVCNKLTCSPYSCAHKVKQHVCTSGHLSQLNVNN